MERRWTKVGWARAAKDMAGLSVVSKPGGGGGTASLRVGS